MNDNGRIMKELKELQEAMKNVFRFLTNPILAQKLKR
jgi:hypothetical protein